MMNDKYLITRDSQPLRMLSWTGAAINFVKTGHEFLKEHGKNIVGQWSPVCFPFWGHVHKSLSDFTDDDLKKIGGMLNEFRQTRNLCMSDRVSELEQLFKDYLEYPPYSLYDDWRGLSYDRRIWAAEVFRCEPRFRL